MKPSLPVIQSPSLAALPGIRHAFFTRQGGVSEGIYASLNGGVGSNDPRERVMENRGRMAAHLGAATENLLSVWQTHSPDVVIAETAWPYDQRPKADAIVTRTPGLAIAVSTADCGPVIFADAKAGVIGAAHAGWKGAIGGVLERTVAAMEQLGASRNSIIAAAGPMLSQVNYETGPEFSARFIEADAANAEFFKPAARDGYAMFDLPGFVEKMLCETGVKIIDPLRLCTYADEQRFFSYRRATHRKEPDYGRLISAIVLEG